MNGDAETPDPVAEVGPSRAQTSSDLTRWNRAGLSRFRYVDGNAVTYLELLRRALADRFPGTWDALRAGVPEDLDREASGEKRDRLLAQYAAERGDWGWEIARVLARACHVLTEHLDAYANEGYLGTATQWDNVRKLVEMLDYRPAPPASASTRLVLATKGAGTLGKGFQIQHTPPAGGAPVVFETLDDLEVDPELDALRPAGWNRSPRTFRDIEANRPAAATASWSVLGLQGVGPVYQRWLDQIRRLEPSAGTARFTFGDFRRLEPDALPDSVFALAGRPGQPTAVLRLRLREFKGKAEVVLGFSLDTAEVSPLLDWTLAEIVAADTADLARRTVLSSGEIERLQSELRQVEIVLDQPVFEAARLSDLVSDANADGGASGAAPASPWIAPEKSGLSAVDLGLVVRDPGTSEAVVVEIDRIDPLTRALTLRDTPFQQEWRHWTQGETSLVVKPKLLRRPRLNGPDVVTFEEAHDLGKAEVAVWNDGASWHFARVVESDDLAVRLAGGVLPAPGTEVFRAFAIESGDNGLLFPAHYEVAARRSGGGFVVLTDADSDLVVGSGTGGTPIEGAQYRRLRDPNVVEIFLVPDGATAAGTVVATVVGDFIFDGKPGKLTSGQWVVADDGEALWPVRIARITEFEDHFVVAFEPSATPPRGAGHRAVGERPVRDLQGVGEMYAGVLVAARLATLWTLRNAQPADLAELEGIPPVRRWEIKTKAEVALGFSHTADELSAVLDETVASVLSTEDATLAARLSRPTSVVAALKDDLRLIEACLDETAFRELRVRELLPEGAAAAARRSSGGAALPQRVVRLYGRFEHTLRPTGWNRNETPLTGDRIVLEGEGLPRLLVRGKRLVLEREVLDPQDESAPAAYVDALETTVREVDVATRAVVLDLDSPLDEDAAFTLGNAVLRANVVSVGHGAAKPEKVLGSGDAARSSQRFVLAEPAVSFIADSTQPSGVKADLEVRVEKRTWQQVANLRDSGPADPHYSVRMTEDGFVSIEFGDGRKGRRLPSGTNNVRTAFRVGTGLSGNLAAGSLIKPARPHRLVASVRQPLPATGGNEMEPTSSLRTNAPASVLTLERAVSVADLSHLATRQSSVWQARAFPLPTGLGRRDSVEVVVVPAGGGPLGGLGETLRTFLQDHTLPGLDVTVSGAEMIAFDVQVTARIKSAAYDPELVLAEVRQALLEVFTLRRRRLGQDLFVSEIYKVVEETPGVESSVCQLEGGPKREASERQVLYLDERISTIELEFEEWTP